MIAPPWREHDSCVEVSARKGKKAVASAPFVASVFGYSIAAQFPYEVVSRLNCIAVRVPRRRSFYKSSTRDRQSPSRLRHCHWNGICNLRVFATESTHGTQKDRR
jgi:hypothetical protein